MSKNQYKVKKFKIKYINNIFSIQVRAESGGGGGPRPHVAPPSCRMKWKENSQYFRTPFYIKRAILDVLRHVFHIAKYSKYFFNS